MMAYGIWNDVDKRFVFGIREETRKKAWKKFRDKVGSLSYCCRYGTKEIPEGWKNPKNPIQYR